MTRARAGHSFFCIICSLLTTLMTFLICVNSQQAHAQDSTTITGEGVSGDIDKSRRSPTVSISTVAGTGTFKILVDAYVADPEYQKYPIQFDFYVNHNFFTSQIRSTELPGPIGVDIGKDVATPPFNYTVIARTLHPNRTFTTVINAAAFASNLSASFDCTLTTKTTSESSIEYISNSVKTTQNGNSTIAISFETKSTPEGHSVVFDGSATITDLTGTGIFTITEDEGTPQTVELSGDVTKTDDKISSINLESADGETVLSCS